MIYSLHYDKKRNKWGAGGWMFNSVEEVIEDLRPRLRTGDVVVRPAETDKNKYENVDGVWTVVEIGPRNCDNKKYIVSDRETAISLAREKYGPKKEPPQMESGMQEGEVSIRKFEGGATRDTDEEKLDYYKAMSPTVAREYVSYLGKHRRMPDGSLRDWDNWKSGMPDDVCMSSLVRHTKDLELVMQGYEAEDNRGPCDKRSLLCAIIFNATVLLHQDLEKELRR